ncbi:MAG: XRE family transcriptional regulator [Comamonadaceae bacterium]|nr:MAG: XRE family transcriptional regulator [Comamonadaceae bacterium]
MDLASYLAKYELKPAQFAERAGVPASTVTRILSGARRPRLDTAAKLAAATDGQVSISDFLRPAEPAALFS